MSFAYDPARQVSVLFSGSSELPKIIDFNDTWIWDGKMAYDLVHQQVVYTGDGLNGKQTWVWDGNLWLLAQTPAELSHANIAGMLNDQKHRTLLMITLQG